MRVEGGVLCEQNPSRHRDEIPTSRKTDTCIGSGIKETELVLPNSQDCGTHRVPTEVSTATWRLDRHNSMMGCSSRSIRHRIQTKDNNQRLGFGRLCCCIHTECKPKAKTCEPLLRVCRRTRGNIAGTREPHTNKTEERSREIEAL